jgi:6-phosphogluconolactonase
MPLHATSRRRGTTRALLVLVAALAVSSAAGLSQAPAVNTDLLVYFGTYTGEKSQGIYVSRLNAATGALSAPQLAAEIRNPSYLAVHPDRAFLYAVSEVNEVDGKPGGAVTAFAVERNTGLLKTLNRQSSGGRGPAHIVTDKTGRNALVANYGGGSVAVLPIEQGGALKPATAVVQHTGSSVNQARQKEPHAHSVNLDPDNRLAYVADLGIDKVMIYRYGAAGGSLTPNDPPFAAVTPGAGPRHFAFHPAGRFAYVINEIDCTVTAFAVSEGNGGLTAMQTASTLPQGQAVIEGYSTADVQVHPSGKFLYGSNRGHDSIVVFAIDEATGRLTYVEHEATGGSTPRAFGIDPTGTFLLAANQRSDSVVVFRIDAATGRLEPTGQTAAVGAPVCVKFVPPAR